MLRKNSSPQSHIAASTVYTSIHLYKRGRVYGVKAYQSVRSPEPRAALGVAPNDLEPRLRLLQSENCEPRAFHVIANAKADLQHLTPPFVSLPLRHSFPITGCPQSHVLLRTKSGGKCHPIQGQTDTLSLLVWRFCFLLRRSGDTSVGLG